ncbi:urease accessory protein [Pseudohyphozyma bogoriensis]|nr:urease accessory protein [Pseudohyphozyma bogoriensis]
MTATTKSRLLPGEGIIKLNKSGTKASFEDVAFSYPLKLIVPARYFFDGTACVYVISYGGGLVAGDRVKLEVEVLGGSNLVMFTQGSTKVFRTRPGRYLSDTFHTTDGISPPTRQLMSTTIHANSTLFLLPSPVTCFSEANYSQKQVFHLEATSSIVLLDWYTSGRMDMGAGEEWQFKRYRSENEIWIDGRRVAKDVLLLEDTHEKGEATETSYAPRVAPYSCYATLLLFGPSTKPLLQHLERTFSSITQYNQSNPYSLLWSFSELEKGEGGIARCAGVSTEAVREWVVQVLQDGGIETMIGEDLWKNAFS